MNALPRPAARFCLAVLVYGVYSSQSLSAVLGTVANMLFYPATRLKTLHETGLRRLAAWQTPKPLGGSLALPESRGAIFAKSIRDQNMTILLLEIPLNNSKTAEKVAMLLRQFFEEEIA